MSHSTIYLNHYRNYDTIVCTITEFIFEKKEAQLGDYQQAIMYFNKAKAINPKYKDNTLSVKGNNLTMLGEYKQAIECYDNSLEIDPEDAHTWKQKGDCLSKLGREKAAQECFDKSKMLESSSQQN